MGLSDLINKLPSFKQRMEWFINHWEQTDNHVETTQETSHGDELLLAIVNRQKLSRILTVMLDESEFLSQYGLRSLSRYHKDHPYTLELDGMRHSIDYEPAESTTDFFGGNSNWRGPIWFPLNYLIIHALQTFYHFYGDTFKTELPTGSGTQASLQEIATELAHRLTHIFVRDKQGSRAVYGGVEKFQQDPYWHDLLLFYEYFHGDNGAGIGANHQTGWTGLIACLLQESSEH